MPICTVWYIKSVSTNFTCFHGMRVSGGINTAFLISTALEVNANLQVPMGNEIHHVPGVALSDDDFSLNKSALLAARW